MFVPILLFLLAEKLKPVVEILASDGGNPEVTVKGSGEVFQGGKISLKCGTNPIYPKYVWIKDSGELPELSNSLVLSNVNTSHSGQYRCKVKVDSNDYTSEASDPVQVTVISGGGRFQSQPVVIGMYNRSMLNGAIGLECINLPSGIGLTFQWYVSGVNMTLPSRYYNFSITDNTVSKNITCKIDKATPAINVTLAAPESVPVNTPSSITANIAGVNIIEARGGVAAYVEVGNAFNLRCRIADTDLAINTDEAVVYSFTKNGSNIATTIDTFKVAEARAADSGLYKCSIKVGTRPAVESAGLTLTVAQTGDIIKSVTTVIDPIDAKPLVGGYLSMQCVAQVRSSSKVTYLWIKGNALIDGQKSSSLQINGVRPGDATTYKCYAATELVTVGSNTITVPAPVTIDSVIPNAPTSDKPAGDAYGAGITYTLTCSSNYETPGMSYQWMESSQVIPGAASKTYTLTAKSGITLYSCLLVFNGSSSKPSPIITIETKNLIRVAIELADTIVSGTTIKPLNNTEVILKCKVTLSASASGAVTYSWLKNDKVEQNQTDPTYTFNAGAASNGKVKCGAAMNNETKNSADVTVTYGATLDPPILETDNAVSVSGILEYSDGASYTILCKTASHTDSVKYAWLKNGIAISGSTLRSYTINNAKKGNDGDSGVYTCKVSQGSSSVASNITITIGDIERTKSSEEPGLPCAYDTDCVGSQFVSSCVNKRCQCVEGLKAKGKTCSGVTKISASLLLLVYTIIIGWT